MSGDTTEALTEKMERLKRENENLKKKCESKPVAFEAFIQEEELEFSGSTGVASYVSKSFKIDTMPVTVDVRNKNNSIEISTTLVSESNYRLAVVAHISSTNGNHPNIQKVAPEIIFIRAGKYDLRTVRCDAFRNSQSLAFKLRLCFFWSPCENAVERGLTGEDVTVVVEKEEFEVNATYLSHWSGFLRAYFASNMKESREGRYPIESCSASDFREMLTVVYPCGKSIDSRNVESLLDLADRFIMPFVTHKCEVFLIDRSRHEMSTMKILQLAEQFNLVYTKAIVIDSLSSADEIRRSVMRAEGYTELQSHTRKCIEAQYIDVDLRNNA